MNNVVYTLIIASIMSLSGNFIPYQTYETSDVFMSSQQHSETPLYTIEFETNNSDAVYMEFAVDEISRRLWWDGFNDFDINIINSKIVLDVYADYDKEKIKELVLQKTTISFKNADDDIILDNNDIAVASYKYGRPSSLSNYEHYVEIELTENGQQKFKQATALAANDVSGKNFITICINDDIISKPNISSEIDSKFVVITGRFTKKEAQNLAIQIDCAINACDIKLIEN